MGIEDRIDSEREFEVPEKLCRVLFGPDYLSGGLQSVLDSDGYLIAHSARYTQDIVQDNRRLPLVHPDEWETIARALAWSYTKNGKIFTVLTFNAEDVEELTWQPHFLLEHGEFFGRIHSSKISRRQDYTWELSDELPNVPPQIMSKYNFKFEFTIGYKPKLIESGTF